MNRDLTFDDFFLCPITLSSLGIMTYDIHRSGPSIEPDSTEPIPPGNYGLYFDSGFFIGVYYQWGFMLSMVRPRLINFSKLLSKNWSKEDRAVLDLISPALEDSVVARDARNCRFTWRNDNTVCVDHPTGAIFGGEKDWDTTPFFNVDNILTMHKSLVRDFLRSYFTVDVDDGYRIRAARRCRPFSPSALSLFAGPCALRRDISDNYSNWTIMAAMNELGVDY
ncbi:hypothetical protein DFH06DRAFT_1346153 [Mycena polygramma]|nr:hypothetical protein DFH06DRAFT_1346153 [Mycena polygramma]